MSSGHAAQEPETARSSGEGAPSLTGVSACDKCARVRQVGVELSVRAVARVVMAGRRVHTIP